MTTKSELEKWQEEIIKKAIEGSGMNQYYLKVLMKMSKKERRKFIEKYILSGPGVDSKNFSQDIKGEKNINKAFRKNIDRINEAIGDYITEHRCCEVCGKSMKEGYYSEGDGTYYCNKKCLKIDLDEIYGKGNWKFTEEENSAGGYITADEDDDLNIYWTDWEDEE